eukprot:gene14286-19293_t
MAIGTAHAPAAPNASTELVQHLIRLGCVNTGHADSGNETLAADLLTSVVDLPGVEMQSIGPLANRRSLVARLPGTDPTAPTLLLLGHTDVVPTNGQPWTSDPFKAEVRNGRLYGRGACDMKGFIGVVLGHAAQFAAAPLRTPIHIALSYDEEVGCLGIPVLLDELAIAGIKPDGCVVGEPTDMQ